MYVNAVQYTTGHALLSLDQVQGLKAERLASKRKTFVDVYRSFILLSTAVAILIVDFVTFPRRYDRLAQQLQFQ